MITFSLGRTQSVYVSPKHCPVVHFLRIAAWPKPPTPPPPNHTQPTNTTTITLRPTSTTRLRPTPEPYLASNHTPRHQQETMYGARSTIPSISRGCVNTRPRTPSLNDMAWLTSPVHPSTAGAANTHTSNTRDTIIITTTSTHASPTATTTATADAYRSTTPTPTDVLARIKRGIVTKAGVSAAPKKKFTRVQQRRRRCRSSSAVIIDAATDNTPPGHAATPKGTGGKPNTLKIKSKAGKDITQGNPTCTLVISTATNCNGGNMDNKMIGKAARSPRKRSRKAFKRSSNAGHDSAMPTATLGAGHTKGKMLLLPTSSRRACGKTRQAKDVIAAYTLMDLLGNTPLGNGTTCMGEAIRGVHSPGRAVTLDKSQGDGSSQRGDVLSAVESKYHAHGARLPISITDTDTESDTGSVASSTSVSSTNAAFQASMAGSVLSVLYVGDDPCPIPRYDSMAMPHHEDHQDQGHDQGYQPRHSPGSSPLPVRFAQFGNASGGVVVEAVLPPSHNASGGVVVEAVLPPSHPHPWAHAPHAHAPPRTPQQQQHPPTYHGLKQPCHHHHHQRPSQPVNPILAFQQGARVMVGPHITGFVPAPTGSSFGGGGGGSGYYTYTYNEGTVVGVHPPAVTREGAYAPSYNIAYATHTVDGLSVESRVPARAVHPMGMAVAQRVPGTTPLKGFV